MHHNTQWPKWLLQGVEHNDEFSAVSAAYLAFIPCTIVTARFTHHASRFAMPKPSEGATLRECDTNTEAAQERRFWNSLRDDNDKESYDWPSQAASLQVPRSAQTEKTQKMGRNNDLLILQCI